MNFEPHYTSPSPEEARMVDAALARSLDEHTTVSSLCQRENGHLRCLACAHRCRLAPERRGICRVRFNQNGQLRVPFGYVSSLACDPVEKKPFFHVLPGSLALTFGMLGCDFHCDFCQNWIISQTLREAGAGSEIRPITPAQICQSARQNQARLVVSSYNEPLITAEWASAIFEPARAAGFLCALVSNGHATSEVLEYLRPWLNACKIDLKCFSESGYRSLGGTLNRITWTLETLAKMKIWTEVVTLLIPGFNDEPTELRDLTRFLASVSREIPWHVTAFHPDYHRRRSARTSAKMLLRAVELGQEAGLHYVYCGNLPGAVGEWENTRCPQCHRTLIERCGFRVQALHWEGPGQCPQCRTVIPGLWSG